MLRNPDQEFTLLLNEKNEFELVPCDQIKDVAHGSREVIAFTFYRNKDLYAVYWHISGNKKIELPLKSSDIILMQDLGKEIAISASQSDGKTVLPVSNRHYIKTSKLTKNELENAFRNATISD